MTNNGTFQIDNRRNKLKALERNVQSHFSPGLSTNNKLKLNPSPIYWDIENETVELAACLLYRDKNQNEHRTNPSIESIQTNLLAGSYFSTDISNHVINNSSFALLSNFNFFSEIKSLYTLINPGEILKYFHEKTNLIHLLVEAHEQIKNIFNNEKNVLRVAYDPEIIGWQKLIIDIHTNLDVDEAFDKLKMLDNIWWLDVSFKFGNDLEINISFDEI
ncbi:MULTISPECIES: hypothetical protein [Aphanizomenon]|jgi:hypothetical protein|uniref:hypothetical protein n=1 Tax=Aphanizomenon TaxID=1175 RepID=UPI00068EF93E|nr:MULTISPECIES: hypothetical protein [Aphanizomenon]MTJ29582.1 hypothetical protein [Aphanizomenon sp. UHCC 0183]QSV70991.1 MAG: hypothetical protein HEQ20_09820 [Aphanizomenon flos-aquae KM1D3_PB]